MPATSDEEPIGSMWPRLATALLCLMLGSGLSIWSWRVYDASLVPIYRPLGALSRVGAIQVYVPTESFATTTELRLLQADTESLAPFIFTFTVTSPVHLAKPPVVALEFVSPMRVSIAAPVPTNRYQPSTVPWFHHAQSTTGVRQAIVIAEPPATPPTRISLTGMAGALRDPAHRCPGTPSTAGD
ncbi:hypothetical protein [Micromonospora sp. NPDC005324]|uniref:hypothetical protein n=1 Tax=Micromonospora sp. NPDC005324 TaxID=3157033 RepID=UPI0033B60C70